jgi:hypothetical protein
MKLVHSANEGSLHVDAKPSGHIETNKTERDRVERIAQLKAFMKRVLKCGSDDLAWCGHDAIPLGAFSPNSSTPMLSELFLSLRNGFLTLSRDYDGVIAFGPNLRSSIFLIFSVRSNSSI